MFLTLPNSAPCSRSSTPLPHTPHQDSRPKSRRHSSLFTLIKSKKEKRKSKPYTHPIDTTAPLLHPTDAPPNYESLYSTSTSAPRTSTSEAPTSPSLHSPTRSRSRKSAHLRKPSQPWTPAPNAPKRVPTFTSEEEQAFNAYSSFYPSPANQPKPAPRIPKVTISQSPPPESPVRTYSTYYPSTSDDLSLFSLFGSAPSNSGSGFYDRAAEGEKKGRRISTGCAWEKIGERRAREGARNW